MKNESKRSTRKTVFIKREFPLPLSDSTKYGYTCKMCGTTWDFVTPYCPFCGRKVLYTVELMKVEERVVEKIVK